MPERPRTRRPQSPGRHLFAVICRTEAKVGFTPCELFRSWTKVADPPDKRGRSDNHVGSTIIAIRLNRPTSDDRFTPKALQRKGIPIEPRYEDHCSATQFGQHLRNFPVRK
jgi:hypothetical protein